MPPFYLKAIILLGIDSIVLSIYLADVFSRAFLTLIEDFFKYLIIYILFKSLRTYFTVDVIKVCYIGLKPGELRYAKLDCSNCILSSSCFFTVLYRTNLLSFGILQRLKVSWKCVLMKSENISPLFLPWRCSHKTVPLWCAIDTMKCATLSPEPAWDSLAVRVNLC